ncbi:hypothetical protein SHIRM173S_07603 [Streptomyces hirsutus]
MALAYPALEGVFYPLFGNIVACHVLDRHARHPVNGHRQRRAWLLILTLDADCPPGAYKRLPDGRHVPDHGDNSAGVRLGEYRNSER